MNRILFLISVTVTAVFLYTNGYSLSTPPSPPGQPESGYGSTENYIASDFQELNFGSVLDGTKCYYYIPNVLKNGDSAPVVVFLHGMMLLAPEIYQDHIEHLCRQGYIVVFPQFQKTILSLMFDMDQNVWLDRAVDAVNGALSRLGASAETDSITIYGHSLGGLMALSWSAIPGAAMPKNLVLANPSVEMSAAMPVSIPGMDWLMNLFIDQINYREKAEATTCPVMILTGDADTIAPDWSAINNTYNAFVNAESRIVYEFYSDNHGDPELKADHMACISDDGWMPGWMMTFLGGDGEVDAVDFRYYWAALDAALGGDMSPLFDMGAWSDGDDVNDAVPVN